MPKGLISGKFNEGIRMNRFWSSFRHVLNLAGNIRNKSASLSCLDIEARPLFVVLFTFQTLDYSISKKVQANPCGFVRENKEGNH